MAMGGGQSSGRSVASQLFSAHAHSMGWGVSSQSQQLSASDWKSVLFSSRPRHESFSRVSQLGYSLASQDSNTTAATGSDGKDASIAYHRFEDIEWDENVSLETYVRTKLEQHVDMAAYERYVGVGVASAPVGWGEEEGGRDGGEEYDALTPSLADILSTERDAAYTVGLSVSTKSSPPPTTRCARCA